MAKARNIITANKFWDIGYKICNEVLEQGGLEDDFYRLGNPDGNETLQEVARIIVEAGKGFRSVWKTIMVGGLAVDQLFIKLKEADCTMYDSVQYLMKTPAFVASTQPKRVSFIRMTVRELGFTSPPTTTQLFERIKKLGELCQPEDAIWLVLENQLCGDTFWIAMNPIIDPAGIPRVFYARWHRGLFTGSASSDDRWGLYTSLVFRSKW